MNDTAFMCELLCLNTPDWRLRFDSR